MINDKLGRIYIEHFSDGTTKDITQEIPFEIPENWAWCRLGEVSRTIQYGVSKSAKTEGLYKLLRITDIQENKVVWENVPFTDIEGEEAESFVLENGDFLFARTGATVGKSYLVENLMQKSVFASYLIRISLLSNNNINYIKYFFNSEYYWQQISEKSVGIGQPNVNGTSLKELLLPLPPLAEQQRIVAKVEELLALVEDLETNKTDLKSYIQQTKAKVLDMAIRGELVPQNPDDEPASVLLERIKNEQKSAKTKGKKTTHNTHYDNDKLLMVNDKLSMINEEVPFKIPENWAWCKLGEVCEIKTGKKDANFGGIKGKYPFFTCAIEPIRCDYFSFDTKAILLPGNGANVGEVFIYEGKFEAYQRTYVLEFSEKNIIDYMYYLLKANWKKSLIGKQFGSATNYIRLNNIETFSIPLPPLPEQKRIVQKIEEIFTELNAIEEKLT